LIVTRFEPTSEKRNSKSNRVAIIFSVNRVKSESPKIVTESGGVIGWIHAITASTSKDRCWS